MIVALTGFMASGKTTFGRAAAAQLGRDFIDLDEAIASRYGSPARLFDSRGEAAFRQIESDLLEEVLQTQRDTVLALGGGTILREENLRPSTSSFRRSTTATGRWSATNPSARSVRSTTHDGRSTRQPPT